MEPTPRDNLRRTVRRMVHRACWQRLEGAESDDTTLADELTAALADEEAPAASDAEIQQWVQDDEADFERALLISELVARRTAQPGATKAAPLPTPTVPPVRAATTRRAPAQPPAIADLLDDMLAQQRTARTPAT